MKITQNALTLEGREFYERHLSIVCSVDQLQVSPREIQVLAAFMELEGDIVKDHRFNSAARVKVRETLDICPAGLSNYLKTLKNKGLIEQNRNTKLYSISPRFNVEDNSHGYRIKITKKSVDNGST
jgi:hypothetical protein